VCALLVDLVLAAEVKQNLSGRFKRNLELQKVGDKSLLKCEDDCLCQSFGDFHRISQKCELARLVLKNVESLRKKALFFLFFYLTLVFLFLKVQNRIRKVLVDNKLEGFLPEVGSLPNRVPVELRRQYYLAAIFYIKQTLGSQNDCMNLSYAVFAGLLLQNIEHRPADLTQCQEALMPQFLALREPLKKLGD